MSRRISEIQVSEGGFWILTRGRQFGPFDYQWSSDLHGIEFTYRGEKFAEICSADEVFADLSPFGLPISVCKVAAITAGAMAIGIANGDCADSRMSQLTQALDTYGFGRFAVRSL